MRRSTYLALFVLMSTLLQVIRAQTIPNTPFSSGFENNTILSPLPFGAASTSGYQFLTGTDLTTGSTWPFLGWNPGGFYVHLDPNIPNSNNLTINQEFCSGLDTMTGHTGATTKALHLCIVAGQGTIPNACCIQEMLENNSLRTPLHGYYFRYWAKYPSSMTSQVNQGHYFYQSIGYYKSSFDHRMEWQVTSNGGGGLWHAWEDAAGLGCTGTSGTAPREVIDPNTGTMNFLPCGTDFPTDFFYRQGYNTTVAVPINQWFLNEIYINRSIGPDGRFFWAINGQTVFDFHGQNYGAAAQEVTNMYNVAVYPGYDTRSSNLETWVDDVLWRDSPPCATLPCGADGTGTTSTVVVPPDVTSRTGVIGTVGVPLSFQAAASNSPTSWRSNSFPSGLSINSSSGLISGTPTGTGSFHAQVTASNSGGSGGRDMYFQINPVPTSAPSISSLTATPSSTNAGQWSRLRWVQSGATTLTLNPGNINVTGQDPFPVNPSVTTTYTLTATNAAGAANAGATVTVIGGPNPPTNLTATVQ